MHEPRVCILIRLSKVLTRTRISLCLAALSAIKIRILQCLLVHMHFKSSQTPSRFLLTTRRGAGSASQLTRHCLGSRPHSSLLIKNEPVPASRFLQRLPAPPHLCHPPSPALSLSLMLSLPLPFPFSTLFRHTLASFVAGSIRLAVC